MQSNIDKFHDEIETSGRFIFTWAKVFAQMRKAPDGMHFAATLQNASCWAQTLASGTDICFWEFNFKQCAIKQSRSKADYWIDECR